MNQREAPDGNALVVAKRVGARDFKRALAEARKAGFSDVEIVKAMANATEMIDAVGSLSAMRVPAVRHPREGRKPKGAA
jgi:hypothetical protein